MMNPFNKEIDSIRLDDWINQHRSENDLREVFLNMDVALKYIHNHDYCIEVFYPSMIEILNHSPKQIQFKKLMELPHDNFMKKQMIEEDIFHSSLLQIGIYSNTLKYLTPEFLKENFDSFIQFIPSDDVAYYRGVVQRGASVYYSDYSLEKRKRDLEQLESELGGESNGKQMVKNNGHNIGLEPISNNKINDQIYRQINGLKDSAFIRILILPTIVFTTMLFISVISLIISYFQ